MNRQHAKTALVCLLVAGLLATGVAATAQGPANEDKATPTFEALLAAAKADPSKADWKALRLAYAETAQYQPYNIKWREELAKVRGKIAKQDYPAAAADLAKLNEREGFMRLDTHMLAVTVFEKLDQKDKAALHRQFMDGILGTLFVPGTGSSFEKPIDVLFIEEEYLFLEMLEVRAKREGLKSHDGHRFDVYVTQPKAGQTVSRFYFNVDLPQKALHRMLQPATKS
jgi:hypothetical protein